MPGQRLDGWEGALAEAIAHAEADQFEWGRHDCCTWVAQVVLALTGRDVGGDWRGTYRSRLGAARQLRRRGGMAALWTRHLGKPLASPLTARRGDVAVYDEAAGIVTGRHAAFLGEQGLVHVPLAACAAAWNV